MTAKRFIVDDCGTLIDMHTRDTFDYVSDVCDLLNRQHETIQRLNENIDELLSVNVEEKLLEENESLKKVIAENEKMIQSTYDELTKLRCIKKNLGRIKAQWNWIMECVDYD